MSNKIFIHVNGLSLEYVMQPGDQVADLQAIALNVSQQISLFLRNVISQDQVPKFLRYFKKDTCCNMSEATRLKDLSLFYQNIVVFFLYNIHVVVFELSMTIYLSNINEFFFFYHLKRLFI